MKKEELVEQEKEALLDEMAENVKRLFILSIHPGVPKEIVDFFNDYQDSLLAKTKELFPNPDDFYTFCGFPGSSVKLALLSLEGRKLKQLICFITVFTGQHDWPSLVYFIALHKIFYLNYSKMKPEAFCSGELVYMDHVISQLYSALRDMRKVTSTALFEALSPSETKFLAEVIQID